MGDYALGKEGTKFPFVLKEEIYQVTPLRKQGIVGSKTRQQFLDIYNATKSLSRYNKAAESLLECWATYTGDPDFVRFIRLQLTGTLCTMGCMVNPKIKSWTSSIIRRLSIIESWHQRNSVT
jgi:hypothetical protein